MDQVGKKRETGEGGSGRGSQKKDLLGPHDEHRLTGVGGCGGSHREGRQARAPLALPERQGAYSRIRVKLSVAR